MSDGLPHPRPGPLSAQDQGGPAGAFPRALRSFVPLHSLRTIGHILPFLLLFLAAACHPDRHSSYTNRLPLAVGEVRDGTSLSPANINLPTVSARICLRNVFERCFTVRKLLLDTGSSGLRIFPSAIPSGEEPSRFLSRTANRSSLWECLPFGTVDLWGKVLPADITLGTEPAIRSLPVQVVEKSSFVPPPPCAGGMEEERRSLSGIDGILGVSPARFDGGLYFVCTGHGCRLTAPSSGEAIENPVMREEKDNNGIVLSFPGVPRKGTGPIAGELLLGVGTERDNRLPPRIRFFPMDRDGYFQARTGDSSRIYEGRLDTGTTALVIPDQKIRACSPPLRHLACPDRETSLSVFISDSKGDPRKFSLPVGNAAERLLEHRAVAKDVLYFSPEASSPPFILGMPFFFGKTLYILYPTHSSGNEGKFTCRC